jgi:protein pelota
MQIIRFDHKNNSAKVRVTDPDDLWYLSHLIDPNNKIKGTAHRKIKIGEGENVKVVRKIVTLSLLVEKVEYQAQNSTLRINGTIIDGPVDFPRGSYQNINVNEGDELTITKEYWASFQEQKLKEAAKPKHQILICVFNREESIIAVSTKFGHKVLTEFKGETNKKYVRHSGNNNFYKELEKIIDQYSNRLEPQRIILASPAFYTEDFLKQLSKSNMKQKIISANISSVTNSAITELLKSPALQSTLKENRARFEALLVDELLKEIGKSTNKYAYGLKGTKSAVICGAATKVLVTTNFISKAKEENNFVEVDSLLVTADKMKSEVHIIMSDSSPGKQLDGLGGIASILRYPI